MTANQVPLPRDGFLRTHERAMAFLRKTHPDKSDDELAQALKQARGITEPAGHARLIETALLLLG
jgi:hypothetical protein